MARHGATSLADELRMMEVESCDEGRSLLPAQDSAEVDSLPEDRGKQGVLDCYRTIVLCLLAVYSMYLSIYLT